MFNHQATDIYKKLLLDNRDDLALNVYVAMCYYKLDYYDVSLEILTVYLQVREGHGAGGGVVMRVVEEVVVEGEYRPLEGWERES